MSNDTLFFQVKLKGSTDAAVRVDIMDEVALDEVLVPDVWIPKSILIRVDDTQLNTLLASTGVTDIELPLRWLNTVDWFEPDTDSGACLDR